MKGLWVVSLVSATSAVHTANWLAVKHIDSANFLPSVFKIGLFVLPLTFISSLGYNVFYGLGAERLPYALLAVLATGVSILISVLITVLGQKAMPNPLQLAGILCLCAGIGLILYDRWQGLAATAS